MRSPSPLSPPIFSSHRQPWHCHLHSPQRTVKNDFLLWIYNFEINLKLISEYFFLCFMPAKKSHGQVVFFSIRCPSLAGLSIWDLNDRRSPPWGHFFLSPWHRVKIPARSFGYTGQHHYRVATGKKIGQSKALRRIMHFFFLPGWLRRFWTEVLFLDWKGYESSIYLFSKISNVSSNWLGEFWLKFLSRFLWMIPKHFFAL